MAKKVTGYVKLQIPAGKATPAPPVGPALGQHGINIAQFVKEFNERTAKDAGLIIPVIITVYADRSFTFITKTPPVPVNTEKVATVTMDDCREIAKIKMPDVNASDVEACARMVAGTARSMGIVVKD